MPPLPPPPPPLASFTGLRSWTLTSSWASFLVFFFLVLSSVLFSFPWLLLLLCQRHRTAIDARPLRPVLESGHPGESIYLFRALAFDSLALRRANFPVLRCTHFRFLYYHYSCQVSQDPAQTKMVMAFFLKREEFMQRSLG